MFAGKLPSCRTPCKLAATKQSPALVKAMTTHGNDLGAKLPDSAKLPDGEWVSA
jgi:hypothetical protein